MRTNLLLLLALGACRASAHARVGENEWRAARYGKPVDLGQTFPSDAFGNPRCVYHFHGFSIFATIEKGVCVWEWIWKQKDYDLLEPREDISNEEAWQLISGYDVKWEHQAGTGAVKDEWTSQDKRLLATNDRSNILLIETQDYAQRCKAESAKQR